MKPGNFLRHAVNFTYIASKAAWCKDVTGSTEDPSFEIKPKKKKTKNEVETNFEREPPRKQQPYSWLFWKDRKRLYTRRIASNNQCQKNECFQGGVSYSTHGGSHQNHCNGGHSFSSFFCTVATSRLCFSVHDSPRACIDENSKKKRTI